ncbi:hypothetical protein G6F57_008247 [Rhizopus arrhizus]|nr:hypothetical protein G6F30_002730 [Rhizopus arrhizus]KAG1399557.1 hypothetical protein G6F58_011112 [Rhizopus delemar]KAG0978630.1 hypothetical protein G6F29_009183 [Rhizopus arrhizus]KAG0999433.1 hypothetical protein G6F28_001019 [Rhizopus arrhizus]KAG1005280.1 hypothetical protein G6F27_009369 [Rhizopus arrhizus]
MRSTFLALALALVASANAASFNKRTVSSNVQNCIKGLTAAQSQISAVASAVNGFSSSSGYAGALAIHSKEQALESLVKTANNNCCAMTNVVNEEEANAVINVVKTLIPDIQNALNTIVSKKDQFEDVALATTIVKTDIKSLESKVNALDKCILAVTPSDFTSVANVYIGQVNTAFAGAKSAYGI